MRRYKTKNDPIDLDNPILQEYVKKRDIVALYIDKWSENSPVTIDIWIDLMKMKKADVVKVVRCKDCKFHFKLTENEYRCTRGIPFYTTCNDFCSYGERGEEE